MSNSSDLTAALAAFQSGDLKRAQALAEQPFDDPAIAAQAQHLLGLVHCRLGDLPAGIVHLAAAANSEPANSAFQLMFVRALIDGGHVAEALTMPEPPRDAAPSSLALWHARAEAADAAGQFGAAIDAWRILCEARPSDWRAWSNLGNAFAADEQWEAAAGVLRRAAALSPRDGAIRRNLASALCQCGRMADGAVELESIVGFEPENLEARLTLARLLTELDRQDEASKHLDHALKITPETAELARERGRQLVVLARFDEAERDYTTALAIGADDPEAVRELGLLLERTNRLDALRELLDGAEAAGIRKPRLSYLWAAIAVREKRFEDARRLLENDDGSADTEGRQRLNAKVADALGDSAAAFDAADAMNRSIRNFDNWRRRGAQYRKWVRTIASVMTSDWVGRLPVLPPGPRPAPAFLVGFPRSGTTLLDTFLMGHPGTRVLEERPMLDTAKQVVGDFTMLAGCSPVLVERAREAYFDELDRHLGDRFTGLVVDKLPLNIIGMPLVHALFTGAPIVFAQRHPCDAVLSGFMQSFVMNDAMACFLTIEDAADLYDATMSVWWKSRELLPLNTRTLVYEELVADPQAALKPLIAFLGLEWSDRLLDHRSTAKARGVISTPSYDQVTQPLSKAPVGRWRRYEKQLEPVLPVLLPWAERLGYSA